MNRNISLEGTRRKLSRSWQGLGRGRLSSIMKVILMILISILRIIIIGILMKISMELSNRREC
jgi:hypothetical protein